MLRGDVWALLGMYVVCLQVDLYVAAVNTVARRVPTVLSVVSSVLFFLRCGALPASDALAPLYAYFVVAVFSLNLNQFVGLFQALQSSIDEFNALYKFPDGLAHAVVYLGAAVMLLSPLAMLGAGRRARVLGALTLWSFNVVDGAIFESNTALDECYLTTQMLYENALFGALLLFAQQPDASPFAWSRAAACVRTTRVRLVA